MTEQLAEKHCVPCEGGVKPLTRAEADKYLARIAPGWELDADAKELRREFKFKGYYKTIAFVNALAWVANAENHHPDLEVSYNRCVVRWTTHAIGGLSENDFICAAKTSRLLDE